MASPPINLSFSRNSIPGRGKADLTFGAKSNDKKDDEWQEEYGLDLVINIDPPEWKVQNGSELEIGISPPSTECEPDWIEQPSYDLRVRFSSCEPIGILWEDEPTDDLDLLLQKTWQTEDTTDLTLDLQSQVNPPDWQEQPGYDLKIQITCCGNQARIIRGYSNVASILINSTGEAGITLEGNGETEVSIISTGTIRYGIIGNQNTPISIIADGYGVVVQRASGEQTLEIITTGDAGLFGGPEIFGDTETPSNVGIYVYSAEGKLKNNIFNTLGNVTININARGTGTKDSTVVETFGEGKEIFIELESRSELYINRYVQQELLMPPLFETREKVQIKIDMVVDIENQLYEIRNIKTNKPYLEFYRYEKWKKQLEIGSYEKDIINIDETFEHYFTERQTIVKKYGCSEMSLYIEISSDFKFIRNPVNIKKLVDKEVERALLDSYALYEFEFE